MHLPVLISDLAIILGAAGIVTLLFKRIGQPVVLGYLLAGLLVGPQINFLPSVQDTETIKVWAEIGVIVLLFGLGIEFSFKKLMQVGRGASITALTEIVAMLAIGYWIGQLLGWSSMDAIFLGGILSISSTTIIIRAVDELGMRSRRFVNLVFGVLIVEDLIAVLLMVLLSTIAISHSFQGIPLLIESGRLLFFLTLWFVGGIFLVPWFLKKTRSFLNAETTLVVSLALCFGMVVLSTKLGFSPALGAFVMGSLFAETPDGHRIEHLLGPIKDLFAAVFFVSIGMLIDISVLQTQWAVIIGLSLVTIVGKLISTTIGAVLSGQPLRRSVQAGMSLAQIGEFSFIIATLGLSLGVTSPILYPIAVAVSAITTFTTPYLIRWADPVATWTETQLPASWVTRMNQVSTGGNPSHQSVASIVPILINGTMVVAVGLISKQWILPLLSASLKSPVWGNWATILIAMVGSLPFIWGLLLPATHRFANRPYDVGAETLRTILSIAGRIALSVVLLGVVLNQFVSTWIALVVMIALSAGVAVLGAQNFRQLYRWAEKRFMTNLNAKEARQHPALAPWDAHLTELKVDADAPVVGQSLEALQLRETFGVTIAMIHRGSRQLVAPSRETVLMPGDTLFILGTDDQIQSITERITPPKASEPDLDPTQFGLEQLIITETSPFINKTIRESGIRQSLEGLVVGIERNGNRILNPDSTTQLVVGDRVWVVGNRRVIREAAT